MWRDVEGKRAWAEITPFRRFGIEYGTKRPSNDARARQRAQFRRESVLFRSSGRSKRAHSGATRPPPPNGGLRNAQIASAVQKRSNASLDNVQRPSRASPGNPPPSIRPA